MLKSLSALIMNGWPRLCTHRDSILKGISNVVQKLPPDISTTGLCGLVYIIINFGTHATDLIIQLVIDCLSQLRAACPDLEVSFSFTKIVCLHACTVGRLSLARKGM